MTSYTDNTKFPGLHYFSVDVETSALRPSEGELLSIGIVVVDAEGNVVDHLYERVDVRNLHESWFNEDLPAKTETQKWWRTQDQFVKDEAYMDRSLIRRPLQVVAHRVRNFILSYGESWTDRIFVASPDKFDWVWTDKMFSSAKVSDPFWYHGIDLFSLHMGFAFNGYALDVHKRFDSGFVATVPHHPLSDAFEAAQELSLYLPKDIIELDEPHYPGYAEYLATLTVEKTKEAVGEDPLEPNEQEEG